MLIINYKLNNMSAFDFEENPDEYEYVYETINASSSSGSNSSTTVAPASDVGFSFSIDHLDDLCPAERVVMKTVEEVRATVADGPAEVLGASKRKNTAEVSTMTDESICLMRGSEDAHVHLSSQTIYASSAEDMKSRAFSETLSSLAVNAQSGIYALKFLQLSSLIF